VLEIDSVDVYYGRSQALNHFSVSVGSNEIVAILGRNGVGKSTLVHTAMGFIKPTDGKISLSGEDVHGRTPEYIFRHGLSLMPQGHRVFRSLTVGETLLLAARLSQPDQTWNIDRILNRFPILHDRWNQLSETLSGGEQQIISMARTLLGNANIVMFDEPSEGLAPAIAKSFSEICLELKQEGRGILLVEQRVQYALNIADRVLVMSRGASVFEGDPGALSGRADLTERYLAL